MTFTLTPEHLDSVLAPLRGGDLMAFLEFVDPEVEWRMGASDEPGKGASGIYNVASFKEYILPLAAQAFEPGEVKHPSQIVEMVGNKSIVEDAVSLKMKNGQMYNNKQCIVMEFSNETGKIVKMRIYVDTEVKVAALRSLGITI